MNQGVEVLLSRMDSNPDEFVGMDWPMKSKWDWLLDDLRRRVLPTHEDKERGYVALRFLSDEEVQALWSKLESLRADEFTKKVMQTLLHEEEAVNPFAEAVRAGMGQLSAYQTKPTKILTTAALKADMLKLLEETAPDLEEASREQILADLQALEAQKTMKIKTKGRYK